MAISRKSPNVVNDTTPQLGGDLDVNGNSIVSASNGDIAITPNGTGDVVLDGLKYPQDDGTAGYVLKTNGSAQLSWVAQTTDTDTTYSTATTSTEGLVKIEDGTAQSTAANAVTTTASRTYGVQLNGTGQAVVNVPWTDTDTNTDTKWDGGTTGLTAATGRTSLGLVIGTDVQAYDATIVVDADIGTSVQGYDADTTKNDVANTFTTTQTLKGITETEATSSASTYTIDLALGTLFEVTHASLCTVTMPTAAAGKAFTVIATVPAAWSGTILWSGGAAPTTGSAKTIYSFVSNGSSWYGMQAGTGFA